MALSTAQRTSGAILGTLLLNGGIRAVIDPIGFAEAYGVPVDGKDTDYVLAKGGRDIAFGASIVALAYRGEKTAAGILLCSALATRVVDTYVTYRRSGVLTSKGPMTAIVGGATYVAMGLWFLQ